MAISCNWRAATLERHEAEPSDIGQRRIAGLRLNGNSVTLGGFSATAGTAFVENNSATPVTLTVSDTTRRVSQALFAMAVARPRYRLPKQALVL